MRHRGLKKTVRGAERVVGRRRLAQIARLITNEVRRDGENEITENGEVLIQEISRQPERPVVLDVGSHFGEWSLSLLGQDGNAPELHAFEPSAFSAERARTAIGNRAYLHQIAMSDRAGTAELFIVEKGVGVNSLVPFATADRARDLELVTLSTVDQFCEENGIEQISLLKIDAEGHDLAVIRGAGGKLAKKSIDMIQFEYNHRWIDSRTFLRDAFVLANANGYRVGKVTASGVERYEEWHPELEKFVEANYLMYLPSVAYRLPTFAWWGG